jgi:hypothetical protein
MAGRVVLVCMGCICIYVDMYVCMYVKHAVMWQMTMLLPAAASRAPVSPLKCFSSNAPCI